MHRVEAIQLPAADGFVLRGEIVAPEAPRAVCVTGHAMMVDRRTLRRVVTHLADRGLAVVWPDLRGHGESVAHDWCYDDLVADVPHLLAFTRERFPGLRLGALGHSLFAHVTLAHLGRHPDEPLDALVTFACNTANPTWRRRPLLLAARRAGIFLGQGIAHAFGRMPVRRLGIGSADESIAYSDDMARGARSVDWHARDGWSYFEALARVRTPLFAISSMGDRFYAPPADVIDFARNVPGARVLTVGKMGGLSFDPGHMSIVLDERARPVWDLAADFLLGVV
jgi:predicted alpha/beta hydrolase